LISSSSLGLKSARINWGDDGGHPIALVGHPPKPISLVADLRAIAPIRRAVAGRCRFTSCIPQGRGRFLSSCAKGHVMSKPENDANNIFRPSDSPLTEYEKEQIALRKNLERLRAERLAREKAKSKDT
jgi:hypothetical protein